MKQATKSTRKNAATKQVRRVVATIALATAAGTAATPAFAAESENDRGGEGIGRAFGSDRPGAKFGGAERGVEVKDDGTVEVKRGGVLSGVEDLVARVVGGAGSVVEKATKDTKDVVEDVVDEPADVVEDVVDEPTRVVEKATEVVGGATDPVEDVVEGVTGEAPDGEQERPEKAAEGDATADSEDEGRGSGKEAGGQRDGAGKVGSDDKKSEGESDAGVDYFASADIDYSADAEDRAPEAPVAGPADDIPVSGELLAFEATAKALGFGPDALFGDKHQADGDQRFDDHRQSGDYEPRHMKSPSASRGGERSALDTHQGMEGSVSLSSDLLAGIGVGNVDLKLLASDEGVDVRVGAGDVKAEVKAERKGLAVEAEVQDVADVEVGANAQGVEASADAAGVAKVAAGVAATGDTADDTDATPDAAASGVEQDVSGFADRGARPLQGGAHGHPGQEPRGAIAPAGAEFLSYQPTTVDRVAEEADAATREATIDAPLRVATTGTEAAALTGLAGALVVGGAGALLVANRSGRNGEAAPVRVPNSTS
ncbi:hypothetical protein [Myceligenerans pegani]|uniref:Gram-positive cocci surface proteins LPxTG domain-containing protein n=1 Tax=Myceligenerans pegani TaxID=2776917 RepID=A0ABR9N4A2_9MICO|nr:hypothetical protein [Myceligenerans sp. TRM 65318]MBE1878001.1 hypothetical protein [Myceligenerans sp. TRM 65318]MBE3020272.1 hypothetical protein [Myceligenerans sp. TRM 65318]